MSVEDKINNIGKDTFLKQSEKFLKWTGSQEKVYLQFSFTGHENYQNSLLILLIKGKKQEKHIIEYKIASWLHPKEECSCPGYQRQ